MYSLSLCLLRVCYDRYFFIGMRIPWSWIGPEDTRCRSLRMGSRVPLKIFILLFILSGFTLIFFYRFVISHPSRIILWELEELSFVQVRLSKLSLERLGSSLVISMHWPPCDKISKKIIISNTMIISLDYPSPCSHLVGFFSFVL